MLSPSAPASADRLLRRTSVRRPVSIWAIAAQLTPEWSASASRLHPSRSRAALTDAPMDGAKIDFLRKPFPAYREADSHVVSRLRQLTASSDSIRGYVCM